MTERERLIDLLNDVIDLPCDGELIADVAEHLLDNGVILPPVKVGDTVYELLFYDGKPDGYYERIVTGYHYTQENHYGNLKDNEYLCVVGKYCNHTRHINTSKIGKTVFLSREDAEAALNKTDLSAGFRKMG